MAAANSATARKPASSFAAMARWAWTKNTASQKPEPSPIMTASQARSVSASLMSPASTAHSMPDE